MSALKSLRAVYYNQLVAERYCMRKKLLGKGILENVREMILMQ